MEYAINHVHIRAADPHASAAWYEKIFNAKKVSLPNRFSGPRPSRLVTTTAGFVALLSVIGLPKFIHFDQRHPDSPSLMDRSNPTKKSWCWPSSDHAVPKPSRTSVSSMLNPLSV